MCKTKRCLKIKNVWKYVVLFFAFICCGFVFNSSNVKADGPTISIPDNGMKRDSLGKVTEATFYVGWGSVGLNSVDIDLDGKWSKTIEGAPKTQTIDSSLSVTVYGSSTSGSLCKSVGITCTTNIAAYTIKYVGTKIDISDGKGVLTVEASNEKLLVLGGVSTLSKTFFYDNKAPFVTSAIVSEKGKTSGGLLGIGDYISFEVELSESSRISKGVEVLFDLAGKTRKAACNNGVGFDIICEYKIVSGDGGDIDSKRTISNVKLNNANNIADGYENAMSSTVSGFAFSDPYLVRIDGSAPSISKVEATAGVYSSSSSISVQVTFDEKLVASNSHVIPTMNVKFGQGKSKACEAGEATSDTTILYACKPSTTDQGSLVVVSLSGGSGLTDSAGNSISLSYTSQTFSNVVVNNSLPTVDGVEASFSGCGTANSVYYCSEGDRVTVTFSFNMGVTINTKTISFKFGGIDAKNDYTSSYDATTKKLEVVYNINKNDDGKMSLTYSFSLTGLNSKTNKISNSLSGYEMYSDNIAPSILSSEVYFGGTKVSGSTIYGSSGASVEFRFSISEDSSITIDASKISIVDRNNNVLYVDENGDKGITSISSQLNNKVLVVSIEILGEDTIDLKIKLDKNAIKDTFGQSLASNYYSEVYTIDTMPPSYSVELVYPQYKGYTENGNWTLIDGNSLNFKINSDDVDLKDYCVAVDEETECESYSPLLLGQENVYSFENEGEGFYSFYIRVRDKALNESSFLVSFVYNPIFEYSNGASSVAKDHYITIDVSKFSVGDSLKYGWIAKDASVSFDGFTSFNKQEDSIIINGESFNGEYRACINNITKDLVLCSDYVRFDTRIDSFDVKFNTGWVKENLATTITFADSSAIKCLSIGKNDSTVNCVSTNSPNVVIYRTYQAVSPFKQYTINENGIYYFYIEDIVGNNVTLTKTITNIDKDVINIEVFNGQIGEYNTNLELDLYKKSHSFLVTFDKDIDVGSKHVSYKYFFSNNKYENITSKDIYNAYYINSYYKQVYTDCNKSIRIDTPNIDGTYYLYIMAEDQAGNVSFKIVENIKLDATGPSIKMHDSEGVETNGGSNSYVAVFDYNISIVDQDSELNLNRITYKWVDNAGNVVLERSYTGCSFGANACIIQGKYIEFGGIFNPSEKYKFVLTAYDNADNSSTFISNEFMLDTIPPTIDIDVDENAWYENGNISFVVSKQNIGTLDTISYCLNTCFNADKSDYDLEKFTIISIANATRVEKSVSLSLENGVNTLVVYASDVFGNSTYKSAKIKHDKENAEISVSGLNESSVLDLTGIKDADRLKFEFEIKDETSGLESYCVYYATDVASKECFNLNGVSEFSGSYNVSKNGFYKIEAIDVVGNKNVYSVSVIGIDTEPIIFDLISNVRAGQYVSSDVVISVVNMRKYMVDEVSERVSTIDYVTLDSNYSVDDYYEIFANNTITSIYNKNTFASLVTSFTTNQNKLFVVRIVDTAGNVSYNHIVINCIDSSNPILDNLGVSLSANGVGRVYNDVTNNIYRYSSRFINMDISASSLMDNNSYLNFHVCFEIEGTCGYNTYKLEGYKNGNYYVNQAISIMAPYNFSGAIKYHLTDEAGNRNSAQDYIINVNYQNQISDVTIEFEDIEGLDIDGNKKYSMINVTLSGEEVEDIITSNIAQTGISYALVKSNINLHNIYANGGSLATYGFVPATNVNFNVTKSGDDTYYLWIYVSDFLGNTRLIKSDYSVQIDTIAPSFNEINFSVEKSGATSYTLTLNEFVDDYELLVDSDNDGLFETLTFVNGKATFSVISVDTVSFELVDEAKNSTYLRNVDITSMAGTPFARAYQYTNERIATVVIYNLGHRRVTSFRYIATDVNSTEVYDESSIAQVVYSCRESNYSETCKGELTSETNQYVLDLSGINADKRLVFYIYVDGSLINLVEKKVIEDKTAPSITITGGSETITTKGNSSYEYSISVEELNMSSLTNKKYLLSKNTVYSYNFEEVYDSCFNSDSCARGVYDLNTSLNGKIEIGANFNKLSSGNYYLYVYLEDDFGNARLVSNSLYIDNTIPVVAYSTQNSFVYETIENDGIYVGGAVTLRILDNKQVSHFDIYYKGEENPHTVCYLDGTGSNVNCNNLVNEMYYNLDTGNYTVKVYDIVGNAREVSINIDGSDPIINIYKKVDSNYEPQNASGRLYNDLTNLYIAVEENNFDYLTIDLVNSISNKVVEVASRFSSTSEIGTCLVDRTNCPYGVSLVSMLVGNTAQYNKIIVKVYDDANRSASVEINYDDNVPDIWMVDVGEIIYIAGMGYTIKTGMIVDVEIGVNFQLSMDSLLSKVILSIDGMSYNDVKNSQYFSAKAYKNGVLFENEICDYIGVYTIKINYIDIAGNVAPEKELIVNVLDNTKAELSIIDDVLDVEIKDLITINGVLAKDNYGLEIVDNTILREKVLLLSNAICKVTVNEVTNDCVDEVVKENDSTYKFVKLGKYTFTYTIQDLAGNTSTISQFINVKDTRGPQMTSSVDNGQISFQREFGNRIAGNLNISNVVLSYPNSMDVGDGENKNVTYEGLYALNNMGEKYKANDVYLIANENRSVTYSFTKVGTYYLRFSSYDRSGNISIFDYEVIVSENIAPIIEGVVNEEVIKLGLEETFSVEYLIEKHNIQATDNYDSNVQIYYELKKSASHSHEVILKASDTSNNSISLTIYVDIEDHVAPIVGELMLDSSTNQKELEFVILGGSDNSGNWWHEYSVSNGAWIKITESTMLHFNDGLSENVQVCIRAVDASNNISESQSCKNILVDTRAPLVNGVKDGAIVDGAIQVSITDDRLASIKVWFNEELLDLNIDNMPFTFENIGSYQIVAKDVVGNETVVSFMINNDRNMEIVNDINSSEYTINSIEFDERFLVRVDIKYDSNGYSNIYTKLDNLDVKANDMIYILGIIPGTDSKFVIFSVNGLNIGNYASGINLIGGGSNFKEGINNEECFVKFNDYYYAYVLIKENAAPIAVVDKDDNSRDASGLVKALLIVIGVAAIVFGGYQIVKLKKRVKAA